MRTKSNSQTQARSQVKLPSVFKKLYDRWLTHNLFHELPCFHTKHFEPQDFLRPLILASVGNLSTTDACAFYRYEGIKCPSAETTLKQCREYPAAWLELEMNHALREHFESLPRATRRYFKQHGVLIIDFHTDPYYGDPTNPLITRGKYKRSTAYGYAYLTADLWTPRGYQTIAVLFRPPGETVGALVGDLLALVTAVVQPKRALMDGAFAVVEGLHILKAYGIHWVGRKAITADLKPLALAYQLTSDWVAQRRLHRVTIGDQRTRYKLDVELTFQRVQQQLKALILPAGTDLTPEQAEEWYKRRFGIESGYRDKHLFQARTTSTSLSLRLVLFYLAIMLWSLWQAYLVISYPRSQRPLPRFNCWRRRARMVRLFLLREALL